MASSAAPVTAPPSYLITGYSFDSFGRDQSPLPSPYGHAGNVFHEERRRVRVELEHSHNISLASTCLQPSSNGQSHRSGNPGPCITRSRCKGYQSNTRFEHRIAASHRLLRGTRRTLRRPAYRRGNGIRMCHVGARMVSHLSAISASQPPGLARP